MFMTSFLLTAFRVILTLFALWILIPLTIQLLIWIVLIITCLTIPMNKEYTTPSNFYRRLFNLGYWSLCKLGRVRIHTSGLENIPYGTRFMLISNHRSKFDNMIHSIVLHKEPVAFISKPENFNNTWNKTRSSNFILIGENNYENKKLNLWPPNI